MDLLARGCIPAHKHCELFLPIQVVCSNREARKRRASSALVRAAKRASARLRGLAAQLRARIIRPHVQAWLNWSELGTVNP